MFIQRSFSPIELSIRLLIENLVSKSNSNQLTVKTGRVSYVHGTGQAKAVQPLGVCSKAKPGMVLNSLYNSAILHLYLLYFISSDQQQ